MQTIFQEVSGEFRRIDLPDAGAEVYPGVPWGNVRTPFTPAFWLGRLRAHELLGTYGRFSRGETLAEELGHCLLGGYGIQAEVGWAAHQRLRAEGVYGRPTDGVELERLLSSPFLVEGRLVRHRFARLKARQLAVALTALAANDISRLPDLELRSQLMKLPGIGPKTASWIVRNYRGSDQVAIIDIHIERAGKVAGIFPDRMTASKDYFDLEGLFLGFSAAIGARASVLDHMMWNIMKMIGWQLMRA